MKNLHAPWRLAVLENYQEARGCILCGLVESPVEEDKKNLILHRGAKSMVLMNRFPYSNGHVMVLPYRHIACWSDLEPGEVLEMNALVKSLVLALKDSFQAQGLNFGANIGEAAGAGIPHHLHWHLVPRWKGDTNFMPLFAEVRVISEHLEASYDKLKPSFEQNWKSQKEELGQ